MFERLSCVCSLLLFAPCFAQAQDVTGDWLGTVSMPAGDLRLALHIGKQNHGLTGTLDSVDQGVRGIPLAALKLTDSKFSFELTGRGTYTGKVDAAAAIIEGEFAAADGSAPITFRRGAVAEASHAAATPSDIDGDWAGALHVGTQQIAVVIHIRNTQEGLTASLDQPDQNVKEAPASSAKRSDSALSIEWKAFGSRFEGKIAEDRSAIEGAVTQGEHSLPLTVRRAKR
jgi:hypothetical protein